MFDNLIYRREMPVTIGVFINPGHTAEQQESTDADWGDRTNNRRVEYNALDDKYARLIVDELLPALKKDTTSRRTRTTAPSPGPARGDLRVHRRLAAARPVPQSHQHHRQLHQHQGRARLSRPDPRSERKPIRIFLQDGLNDNRGLAPETASYDPNCDWHAQNIKMVAALTEKSTT